MKKLEKFAGNAIVNLHQCVGGTVYQTCGENGFNCQDEAGSRTTLKDGSYSYDDVHDYDETCHD